jgi:hypothetical protein
VLALMLIALAPTILSSGMALSIIVDQVNKQLNGSIQIGSLSLGWFSGITAHGIRVFDQNQAQIAELDDARLPLPLWKAVMGHLSFGNVVIDNLSFDARYDADGRLNFSTLVKPKNSSHSAEHETKSTESKSSGQPNLSGNFKFTNCRGTVSLPGKPTVYLTQFDADVKIPDMNQLFADQITAAVKIGDNSDGSTIRFSLANSSIQNLLTARDMQLHASLDYDLASLWPIIQPMLGEKYKGLSITGHYQKQFNITGSYPANQPFSAAIQTVKADGDLAVESLAYNGLNLQNVVVPFMLAGGKVTTVYARKPPGQNTAPPATANGGTLYLGDLTVDLAQDPPVLSIRAGKVLVSHLTINPLFTGTILARIVNNPVFTGAKQASGLLDLTADDCTDLPLSDRVMEPGNSGKIDLRLSLTKLNIGLAGNPLEPVLKQNSFEANVNDGTIAITNGICTEHIKFMTGEYTLGFDGKVRLSDQAFMPMIVSFPIRAIAQKTRLVRDPNVIANLPESLNIQIEGTVQNPKYGIDKKAARAIAQATEKALLGGKGGRGLKGILKGLGREKSE